MHPYHPSMSCFSVFLRRNLSGIQKRVKIQLLMLTIFEFTCNGSLYCTTVNKLYFAPFLMPLSLSFHRLFTNTPKRSYKYATFCVQLSPSHVVTVYKVSFLSCPTPHSGLETFRWKSEHAKPRVETRTSFDGRFQFHADHSGRSSK